MAALRPAHRAALAGLLVPLRAIPVADSPGEQVWVVAERDGHVLYWSDVEEGWEWEPLDAAGGVASRGCNQYELEHVAHRLFDGGGTGS